MHPSFIPALAVLLNLCYVGAEPVGAVEPRITNAPALVVRQTADSCWSSAPFESCLGTLNNEPGLCQGSALVPPLTPDASYTSCACSTNSIYLPCWSSYCSGDPGYAFTLSEFERDSTIFCGGGGGGPATAAPPPTATSGTTAAPAGTTTAAGAAATTSTKSNAAAPARRSGRELALFSAIVMTWLAIGEGLAL